jgi:hypothetical protein
MKKKMSIDENFMRSAKDPAAMAALLKQSRESEGKQAWLECESQKTMEAVGRARKCKLT